MREVNIISLFKKNEVVNNIINATTNDKYNIFCNGITLNHGILLASTIFRTNKKFVVYVCSNAYAASKVYDGFCEVISYDDVNLYLIDDIVATEAIVINNELKQERINTLESIINNTPKIIVTHIQAMSRPVISKENLFKSYLNLHIGMELNVEELIKTLIKYGYKRVPTTYALGNFSVRGEVIDIFSSASELPFRINLDFDEIKSIKYFDLETQLTKGEILNKVSVFPTTELPLDVDLIELEKTLLEIEDNQYVRNDFLDIKESNLDDKLHKYINYIDPFNQLFIDYLTDPIIINDNFKDIQNSYEAFVYEANDFIKSRIANQKIDLVFYKDFYEFYQKASKFVYFDLLKKGMANLESSLIFELNGFKTIDYQNDLKMLLTDLKDTKGLTFLAFRNEARLLLIKELLQEASIECNIVSDIYEINNSNINLIVCPNALSYGIHNYVTVIFEDEIFKKNKSKKTKYRSANENSIVINSKEDLLIGDYVVHFDYGIARYIGIKTEELNGIKNDYLSLQFENISLLVPMEKITELEKYIGSEGAVPKLTKIGTNEWEKRKKAVKEQLENIARELIELQIKRDCLEGHKYSSDSDLQKQFEEDFAYEETKDQITIVNEIKKEMEKGVLIDRLVCGDVGFGKTEIAMRIAFKTVFEGFQVVYLAPTTILTRQHYHTFKDRFLKYGIKVELYNRLISTQKAKEIVEGLKNGTVDIVIATHRIFSSEIKYKKLGLLVIDEEQRFGVNHKEKIKKLKEDVNVLTLTATPIPRTFQMAVMGMRSLSLLETPPKDRYPIQTYVLEYSDLVIKEAIYREIARGGQVFYLHNRVSDLIAISKKIKKLVPDANVCIGHGKMDKNELEDVISNFIDGIYNVLICTTIIETGIDIPNSNTLIVDDSYRLGLAQMYQIRGRVGRSDRIAYAYFTYPIDRILTETAQKRLGAIKELTKIGSGYKIATRDLAIRGAGDILGSEQSGFINSIGIDMYMKLLNEAVEKAKGIVTTPKQNYRIEIAKHVERNYVDDDTIIIYIHKEINNISSIDDKEKTILELTNRFGALSNNILDYIEERYLESNLRKMRVNKVIEHPLISIVNIPKEISKDLRGESVLMAAYAVSERLGIEYKDSQFVIKVTKKEKDRSWIYILNSFFENLNKNFKLTNTSIEVKI